MISEVQASDAGKYECWGQNMAATKISPPAVLKVLAPPTIIRGPQDTEVVESEGLDLPCEITGDPKPIVIWTRENSVLPEGRSRILLDNTLRIEDARPEDQGRYICKAHNEGGNVSVAVKLHVYGKLNLLQSIKIIKFVLFFFQQLQHLLKLPPMLKLKKVELLKFHVVHKGVLLLE